jgi:O-methyltransferase domain
MMFGEEFSTRAYEHIADCLRTGGDGVTEAYGKDIWAVLAERPEQCETFQRAMTNSTAGAADAIVEAYDFSSIERLADVGGGHGLLLASVLRRYPKLEGVLYDRPEVVAGVPQSQFAGCEGRIGIEAGSFFEHVPDGCDAYMVKHIIHDWSDEHCRTILRLMRDKLPKNGRVLICEMVVGDEPGPTPAKMLDIEMLVMTVGGRERTAEEFGALFATSGLRLNRVVPTARPVCVIEAVPA